MYRLYRWKSLIWIAAIPLVVVAVNTYSFFVPVKGIFLRVTQPFFSFSNRIVSSVKGTVYSISNLQAQLAEKDILARELEKLHGEKAVFLETTNENQTLRDMLNLKDRQNFTMAAASVVSRDPTSAINSVIIDKGSVDGVSKGDVVLDDAGALLGVVREVYARTSEFLLVTNGLVKIDAKVAGKEILGVISGSHSLGLSFDLISHSTPIIKGDTVISSGLSGSMPKDVLIGYVEEPQSDADGLFKKITVTPAAKMIDIQFVFIVTSF